MFFHHRTQIPRHTCVIRRSWFSFGSCLVCWPILLVSANTSRHFKLMLQDLEACLQRQTDCQRPLVGSKRSICDWITQELFVVHLTMQLVTSLLGLYYVYRFVHCVCFCRPLHAYCQLVLSVCVPGLFLSQIFKLFIVLIIVLQCLFLAWLFGL